jgi:hypothetical protein
VPEISETLAAADRRAWRDWLAQHGTSRREIWLIMRRATDADGVGYLEAVEEALCFGWIDGIAKRDAAGRLAQRFTPRQARSHWTELNKARARRLIRLDLMTDAGRAALPALEAPFVVAADIEAALRAAGAWERLWQFPELYRRVRVGSVEEMRRNAPEFARRLEKFMSETAAGRMFGQWNDGGLLGEEDAGGIR